MMSDELILKEKMKNIARKVDEDLPQGFGFIVLAFRFNAEGEMIYVSNANREGVVQAMKEFIEKTENNYGNDIGKH